MLERRCSLHGDNMSEKAWMRLWWVPGDRTDGERRNQWLGVVSEDSRRVGGKEGRVPQ